MDQRWKPAHHVRRRTGEPTTTPSAAAGSGSNSSANRSGGSNTSYLPQSSLFCAPNGADLAGTTAIHNNTSFLKDEEGLTDIIENAFDRIGSSSRLYNRSGSGRSSVSLGSAGALSSNDSDNEDFQSSIDEAAFAMSSSSTGKHKKMVSPSSFWNSHLFFATFPAAPFRKSGSGSSLLRGDNPKRPFVSSTTISPRVARMTCLLALGVVVSLSLRNASQNLKKYGQLHRTGSIYGGNRASRMHQQQKQEQLHLMQEAQSQGQEIYKSIMNAPNVGLPIPSAYKHLAEVSDVDTSGIPFFWHLPRSGGSTVRDLLTDCYGLVMATGQGKVPNDLSITALKVLERPLVGGNGTVKFINVDVYTKEGIEKAKQLGLASSGLVDVISSRLLLEASSMFTADHFGRLFTIFRHPIHRAVSTFHFVQDTVWRRNRNDLADISIEEYFKSGSGENNFITRYLTGGFTKVLTEQDLNVAKEILRRKCIVGLLEEKVESMRRFEKIFGWKVSKSQEKFECREKRLQWGWSMYHQHDLVKEGSVVWDLILKLNEFDMQLYEYARLLFQDQRRLFT